MNHTRFNSILSYITIGMVLLLVLGGLFVFVERRQAQAETGPILSALFTQQTLGDKWGAGRKVEIVILQKSDCGLCSTDGALDMGSWFTPSLKSRRNSLSNVWFAQSSRITRSTFFINSTFSDDIRRDLTLPQGTRAVFVDRKDLGQNAADFQAKFPHSFGFYVVSHVGMNLTKTEALLYIEHYCGGLCGGGDYVLMRKVNGTWQVIDRHGTWVS
jgi:hypothetical protein